ncbi:MAG: ATP-binding protein [Rhodocyclaceae bacterium]|nr:ATP-binding protein [Rhodocyclaceae bacterium]MDZ4214159.1 ATP-binding protein [Rhodocyclaceae bacterium]
MKTNKTVETLSSKTYVRAFIAVTVSIVLLLTFFLVNTYRQTIESVEVAMMNMVASVNVSVDASLRRIEADLGQLTLYLPAEALQLSHVPRYAAQVQRDLDERVAFFDEVSSYRVFDAEGNSLYNSGKVTPVYSVADRAYFQAAKAAPQQALHFSEAITGRQTFDPVVVIAKAIVNPQGRFLGVVVGALKMRYYSELFASLDVGKGGAMALRRAEDGALVARWPELQGQLNEKLRPDHPILRLMQSGQRRGALRMTAQADHQERLYVFDQLTNYPFVVFAGRATPDYLAEWRVTAMVSCSFVLLVLLGLAYTLRHHWQVRRQEMQTNRDLAAARDAAEAASRAKSTFLSNMSHELRTPMNGIIGMTGLALRHTDDPHLRDQLSKIDQASQHLLAVVNDILDISKIEAERLVLERVDFRLGAVLENVLSMTGHKAAEKGVRLLLDLPAGLPALTLVGDPFRLGQVLLNLVGNALKFTEQGTITLRAQQVESLADRVLLRWEVQDTGIGITPEDQQRLFRAFEQADGSMTRKYGGTGLGLAISKRLVEMMGGEIGVTSVVGQGSTFWFAVWIDKETRAHAVAPASTFSNHSADERLLDEYAGTRVLLVEDEPINQEVSRGLLEDCGMAVDVANDGVEAVALARQQRYALILMDMQLPNLNGVEATQQIRADSLNSATPILAMTANAFEEDRQACLAAGMNDHLPKPIDPPHLYETLLRWLARAA